MFVRQFNKAEVALADEVVVNSNTRFNQSNPAITVLADGSSVITYESEKGGNALYDIYAQRLSGAGQLSGTAVRVNTHTQTTASWGKRDPAIASNGTDRLVVVWADNHDHTPQDGRERDESAIFGKWLTDSELSMSGERSVE